MHSSSPVLDALPPARRDVLLERAVPRRLEEGDILFLAGERNARVHLLTSGVIKLVARDGDGNETILALSVAGDLVGETAALDGLPQPLDAVAAIGCELVGFDADDFVGIVGESGPAALELARTLVARSRWICDTALERTSQEVPARLAGRLLDLADLLGRMRDGAIEMDLPVPQADLGRMAGICRESACKTLRRLKRNGVVDYEGRRLRILRPDLLERIRCGQRLGSAQSAPHDLPRKEVR